MLSSVSYLNSVNGTDYYRSLREFFDDFADLELLSDLAVFSDLIFILKKSERLFGTPNSISKISISFSAALASGKTMFMLKLRSILIIPILIDVSVGAGVTTIVGAGVGVFVGAFVGALVGASVGGATGSCFEGATTGAGVPGTTGATLGKDVGLKLGLSLGIALPAVGAIVDPVGAMLGTSLGNGVVAPAEGATVGEGVPDGGGASGQYSRSGGPRSLCSIKSGG